uniref:Transposase IS30-like HTH domain-containing protein n=1 Tax=Acanthochromis polyacanthus TaxID=80966 RepID=A0A3Q1G2S1_9TELE
MEQLTIEERQTIIRLKNVGLSYREIVKTVKVSVSTVFFTIKRHSETGGNSDRKRSGRPKVAHRTTVSTVKRRLGVAGLTGRVAARKALLTHQNKKKRLAWTMECCQWTTEDWKKILWTIHPSIHSLYTTLSSLGSALWYACSWLKVHPTAT